MCVLAVLAVGVVGYRSATGLVDTGERVAHTHEVQAALSRLMLSIANAEGAVRGYIIASDPGLLTVATASRAEATSTFEQVARLTADNPGQQARWVTLREQMTRRFALLDAQVQKTPEQRQALTSVERAVMAEIQATITAANDEEAALLETRERASRASAAFARVAIVGGAALTAVLALVLGIWISGSVSRQVQAAVADVRSSSAQLQASASQQASGVTEQSSAMSQIASTTNELLASSRQIATTAYQVSQIAGETAVAAQAGDATMAVATEASRSVRLQFDQVVQHMLGLGRQSQQISAVVDVVRELAEQTNILAINATVEAAGAGEAGIRFGVVASEVRKLADRVAGSAKEIRALVEDVRGAVNKTVMVTEAGSKALDAGAAQVAASGEAFRRITSLVGKTEEASREIELSTKQQVTAVEQVSVAVTATAQSARETQVSAEQTALTSLRLSELSNDLMRIVVSQQQEQRNEGRPHDRYGSSST